MNKLVFFASLVLIGSDLLGQSTDQRVGSLLNAANSARNNRELQLAADLYSEALELQWSDQIAHERGCTRLLLGDSTGYCLDAAKHALQEVHGLKDKYRSICQPCDSMSFETSGLSMEFHRTKNVTKCLDRSKGSITTKLYNEKDSLDAVFYVLGKDTIFGLTGNAGTFPGGEHEMMRFMGSKIKYPAAALDAGISGVVYATFIIEIDDSISDIEILRSPHPSLDHESVRVIQQMPQWSPAAYYGRVVRSRYTLPIRFTLR